MTEHEQFQPSRLETAYQVAHPVAGPQTRVSLKLCKYREWIVLNVRLTGELEVCKSREFASS